MVINGYEVICENGVCDAKNKNSDFLSIKIDGPDKVVINKQATLTVSYKSNIPAKEITWTSSDDSIAAIDSNGVLSALAIGDVTITAKVEGKKAYMNIKVVNETYEVGDIVYFDPVTENACNNETFSEDAAKNGGTCYKWRIMSVNDNENNKNVKIQLDHNIVPITYWSNNTSTSSGPTRVFSELNSKTSNWTRLELLNFEYDSMSGSNGYGILTCVDGVCTTSTGLSIATNVRVRLATIEEIIDVLNSELIFDFDKNVNSSEIYFSNIDYILGTNTKSTGAGNTNFSWLLENTVDETNSGATKDIYSSSTVKGFWTLSPCKNNSRTAWSVNRTGYIQSSYYIDSYYSAVFGLRPFVEINKTLLSK